MRSGIPAPVAPVLRAILGRVLTRDLGRAVQAQSVRQGCEAWFELPTVYSNRERADGGHAGPYDADLKFDGRYHGDGGEVSYLKKTQLIG